MCQRFHGVQEQWHAHVVGGKGLDLGRSGLEDGIRCTHLACSDLQKREMNGTGCVASSRKLQ
jgi:hypothetical protein